MQRIPQIILEDIFHYLKYEEVFKLSSMCRAFHDTASVVLRSGVGALVPKIERQIVDLEQLFQEYVLGTLTIREYLHIALLHTVLLVLHSEARVLMATCWRFFKREDSLEHFCFPAGDLLDEFEHILTLVRDREINKTIEPEITTRIYFHNQRFLDFFDSIVEPNIARIWPNAFPNGIKIIDILDCCQCSNFHITVTHNIRENWFFLSALYDTRDLNTIDCPPVVDANMTSYKKTKIIFRYLRNNVRWNNLFRALRTLWELEDIAENGQQTDVIEFFLQHFHFSHGKWLSLNTKYFLHKRERIKEGAEVCRDEFKRELMQIGSRFGLTCDISLQSQDIDHLPLDMHFLGGFNHSSCSSDDNLRSFSSISNQQNIDNSSKTLSSDYSACDIPSETSTENDNYNFSLIVRIQFPSVSRSLGHKEIKVLCPPEVDVACHNSINSSTISGPEHIVIQFVNDLKKKDIFARAVNVANIAYHSRYIQPAAPKLLRYLKQLITDPKPRSSKWISSSVPESEWDTPLAKYSSPEYHTNNLLKEVLFEESTTHIPNNAIVIEIAPHGLLQAILRRSFGSECIHIPLTLRGHPNSAEFLLTAVGK
uniref:F-box domain-containing protein n=1 Tax=Timema cristinae TaxID=61476 RepID=A0A7R9CSR7_TIMCR|nr:unnamed protein product [Timema cristinae]